MPATAAHAACVALPVKCLLQNRRMLELAASQGFSSEGARDGIVRVSLDLQAHASEAVTRS